MPPVIISLALGLTLAAPPPPAPAPAPKPTVLELLPALEACQDTDCPALVALVERGDAAWPDLEQGIDHKSELVRFWSIGVLATRPIEAARGKLLKLLATEPAVRIRAASAFALAGYPGADVTAELVEALADPDPNVRFEATSALGRRPPDVSMVAPLVKLLDDKDDDVRAAAAETLGALGAVAKTPEVAKALLAKVNDRRPAVRGRVAIALGQLGVAGAPARLLERVGRERDEEALAAMAWALGELRDPAAKDALEKLTTHASAVVKQHAEEALAKLVAK